MNENDTDRYLWRTGQRWSGDGRHAVESSRHSTINGRVVFLLGIAFLVSLATLVSLR